MVSSKLQRAFESFDAYNSNDPHQEVVNGKSYPKEYLYGVRMTERLNAYAPDANEHVQLAARCQHIGRWEIPRNSFPMDRKGYLQWRSRLALHHARIASTILATCGYDEEMIEKVKFLLQKKELHQHHPETQLLEDVVCLVFIEFYLADFAQQHEDDKVVDILKKTIKKMSSNALNVATTISMSPKISQLVARALN
ncbi:DUF4202 domain-containing protein [Chryseosolibacter indicus]|uniref:DUF4202 family protein n=1 Tax=Chryseosolibacter indicus TaxID=2782351 RepID=A0ABS5VRX2_9BACT|nr:DUF4202 domain-containing protein [Chryseosolibacter indicus]MBT1702766.1 DUF4202 family protein [Chryseosolibacter indicus]